MPEVALPEMPQPAALRGVILERHEMAGALLFSTTTCVGLGRAPRRRWFAERSIALAHAAELADTHSLALLDMSDDADGA